MGREVVGGEMMGVLEGMGLDVVRAVQCGEVQRIYDASVDGVRGGEGGMC